MPEFIINAVIDKKQELELEKAIAVNEGKLEIARQLEFRLMDIREFLKWCF